MLCHYQRSYFEVLNHLVNHKYHNCLNFRTEELSFSIFILLICFILYIFNHVLISLSTFLIDNCIEAYKYFFLILLLVTSHCERMFPCEYFQCAKQLELERWNILTIVSRNVAGPLHLMKGTLALLCIPGTEVNPVLPTPIQDEAAVNNTSFWRFGHYVPLLLALV